MLDVEQLVGMREEYNKRGHTALHAPTRQFWGAWKWRNAWIAEINTQISILLLTKRARRGESDAPADNRSTT